MFYRCDTVKYPIVRGHMATLQLTNYKRKAIYAYLCPVSVVAGQIQRGQFCNGKPVEDGENENRYFCGKSATVEFDLSKFEDGVYEWKEAVGHKSSTGFIRVVDGDIISEWETSQELIASEVAQVLLNQSVELPPLEGSERQIVWAEQIRQKAIAQGYSAEKAAKVVSAKKWIDNRDKFK